MKWFIGLSTILLTACSQAQQKQSTMIVNDEQVEDVLIVQLEKTYGVKFVPGKYWYDPMSGAFGLQGGPCTGVGVAGLQIGGALKANASGGGTNVFINGRELHPMDVKGLQTFMYVMTGRYWMDAYGNFGYEKQAAAIANVYLLWQAKFSHTRKSSYYKNNVWSGEKTSFGSDGSFMYYSSKKTDGTTYDYNN